MSEVKVNKISPRSGTNVQLGDSGDTITVPSGATLDASNATTTLPANVVTTTGSQTLTNKIIGSSQLTGALPALDGSALTGIPDTIAPTRHSIRPSLNLDFANSKALDPRITFTRASNATYYDGYTSVKAEENLFQYSQDLDNSYWTSVNSSIGGTIDTTPDGTYTNNIFGADGTTNQHFFYTNINSSSGNNFTASFYAKIVATNQNDFIQFTLNGTTIYANFDIANGTVGSTGGTVSTSITDVGNGWYRCSITYLSSSENQFRLFLITSSTSARAENNSLSTSMFLWGLQLEQRDSLTAYTPTTSSPITKYQPALQTAGNNVARFDHNPTTGESLGLLIEESRTNLQVYSEEFDNAGWSKGNTTITSNTIIAPDGTLTADKLVEDTSTGEHTISDVFSFTSGTTYTGTIYAKKAERTLIRFGGANTATWSASIIADLSNGTIANTFSGSGTITDVGNDWYRISVTGQALATAGTGFNVRLVSSGTTISYTGDGYSGVYIWGAQLEQGSFPTSYIKTTGSQVTRSRDETVLDTVNEVINNGDFTTFINFKVQKDTLCAIYGFTDSSLAYNQSGYFVGDINNSYIQNYILNSGTDYYNSNSNTDYALNQDTKYAVRFERNNVHNALNGTIDSTGADTSVPIMPQYTRLSLGCTPWGKDNQLNGTIKKFSIYPTGLTDNELVDLTEE